LGWVWVVEKVKNFFVCSLFPKTFGKGLVWSGKVSLGKKQKKYPYKNLEG
jgi:hypothetical protein